MQQKVIASHHRSPVITGVMALICGPWMAMLYLGRAMQAVTWFIVEAGVSLAVFAAAGFGWLTHDMLPFRFVLVLLGVVAIVRVAGLWRAQRLRLTSIERPWFSRWYWLIGIFAAVALAAEGPSMLGVRAFVLPSSSMAPTLNVGDNLLTRPVQGADIRRGDIVVFEAGPERFTHIKRVIGLSGDQVQMIDGMLRINGETVPYTAAGPFSDFRSLYGVEQLVEALPDAPVHYVLNAKTNSPGDNTRAIEVPDNHVFVMGDHRDNSMDSRFPQIGLVPLDAVEGKFWFLYWNDVGISRKGRTP